jgi:serine acetyltransferase
MDNRVVNGIYKGFRLRNSGLEVVLKRKSSIKYNVTIQGSGLFTLGERSYLSHDCIIGVNEKDTIGKNGTIASSVPI